MVTLVTVVSMGATALETVRVITTKLKVVQTDCFDSDCMFSGFQPSRCYLQHVRLCPFHNNHVHTCCPIEEYGGH